MAYAHHVKTWRHPQNRKYIYVMSCRQLSEEYRATAVVFEICDGDTWQVAAIVACLVFSSRTARPAGRRRVTWVSGRCWRHGWRRLWRRWRRVTRCRTRRCRERCGSSRRRPTTRPTSWRTAGQSRIHRQWPNCVPCLCQLVFAAILWVTLRNVC